MDPRPHPASDQERLAVPERPSGARLRHAIEPDRDESVDQLVPEPPGSPPTERAPGVDPHGVLPTHLTGMPLIGTIAGVGGAALVAAQVGPMILGAILGGLMA